MEGMTLTISIIIITCLVSFTTMNDYDRMYNLSFRPYLISERKQYYRFLTAGLVHVDFMHLAFNMFALYSIGRAIEQQFEFLFESKVYYLMFYVLGIILSSVPTYIRHRHDSDYSAVGASGAVSAVIYAAVLFQPWASIYVFFIKMPLIVFAVLYLAMTAYLDRRQYNDGINHSAHLWGAIYGLLFPIVFKPSILLYFIDQLMHPSFRM